MAEALEQTVLRKLPLDETHRRLGVSMYEREGWLVPASYGDVAAEYAAVREASCGIVDLSSRGRILVSGSEAVQFLNGLITNDMKTLAANSWMPAAFPNVQGRLIASVRVFRLSDEEANGNASPTFLIDTEPATSERMLETIERFTLAGDFHVVDVTTETALLSVHGSAANQVVRSILGDESAAETNGVARVTWQADGTPVNVTVIRATHTAVDGFDLILEATAASGLWNALHRAGARPVGYDALEMLRIEAGVPRYGVDMDETNIVTETGLDDAVSYTKGCYVGQEIIARIKYRGHVAKKLSGLVFTGMQRVTPRHVIKSTDGKEIGQITSATYSPHLRRTIALGYLKYDYLAPGTEVKVSAGDEEIPAQVTELPFVRGS